MAWSWLWQSCLMATIISVAVNCQQTGQHPDWPRWCGKVYQPGYPTYDPGGQTRAPLPAPGAPLLHVLFQPRYSLYLDSEEYGEFIVNAELSDFHGKQWPFGLGPSKSPDKLVFSISLVENDDPLVQNTVHVNTTSNLFRFNLSGLKPRLEPIQVVLYGAPEAGTPTWTATSSFYYLPEKTNGSITRIDNLNGGLWFRNAFSNHTFTPFFPYGFYASYDGFLRNNNTADVDAYASLSLNAMVPLTTFPTSTTLLNHLSHINLPFIYSSATSPTNHTTITTQILLARTSPPPRLLGLRRARRVANPFPLTKTHS
ncbi:hypothetical protein N0V88_001244 [Collariella sp. IMI 366227]|nr:hypothetical protein N0V88_001244 [Collariella sp. IMI 366227]